MSKLPEVSITFTKVYRLDDYSNELSEGVEIKVILSAGNEEQETKFIYPFPNETFGLEQCARLLSGTFIDLLAQYLKTKKEPVAQ